MINSKDSINTDLLDLYAKTGDKRYLDKWYETNDAVVLAMRLANYTVSRDSYKTVVGQYEGSQTYASKTNMVNPDVLSYSYEAIGTLLYSWEPVRSKFTTYVYNYGPGITMRLKRQVEGTIEDNTAVDYDDLDTYQDVVELYGEYGYEKEEALEKLEQIREILKEEADIMIQTVFDEMLGRISPEEASDKTGIKVESLRTYRGQVREYIKDRVGGVWNG